MNPSQKSLLKFRPVLTLEQIQYIISLCQCDDAGTTICHDIRKVLVPMVAKIEVGAINPAYKLSEINIQKQNESKERSRYENNEMSSEEESIYELKVLGEF
jgi:hypothetical protein